MVVCKCRKATRVYCFVHKVPVCYECICFPEHQLCVEPCDLRGQHPAPMSGSIQMSLFVCKRVCCVVSVMVGLHYERRRKRGAAASSTNPAASA
ncbi:hypothetical protein E2562_012276 [Oryza meyeriana var. granulata]|uniref:ZFPL1-like B-box zinc-binding domain-containing protein n=1 Tax=Oryza meyeriana var. granulata TaxID=110450 RepID=A0A6G1DGN6_9ORYZ|nr:hypothetical protein E2562_012276 [Oryza meyeriana var. granulata]